MTGRINKNFVVLMAWGLLPPLSAIISVAALLQGIKHPWIDALAIVSLGLCLLIAAYAAGMCSLLYRRLQIKQHDLEMSNESFAQLKKMNEHLSKTLENLSSMREIQMSSHLESFSDLLKNILSVTHGATDARALTIYLESHRDLGAYPKAHMRWAPADDPLPGEFYIFLNEEIPLEEIAKGMPELSIDPPAEVGQDFEHHSGTVRFDGKEVGLFHYKDTFREERDGERDYRSISSWLKEFTLYHSGVMECWDSKRLISNEEEDEVFVSVPIISQRLTVGVLTAEFVLPADREQFFQDLRSRHMDALRDFGRNIGHPLKKEELYEMATKDSLTGLFNKAHYETQLNDYFHRMVRYHRDLSYMFIDIDHFKSVNDTYGHLMGDEVLKGVSRIIRENIRKSDMAFRIGGEELCVILIETPMKESVVVAEKLRSIIEMTVYEHKDGRKMQVTASFGIANLKNEYENPSDLVEAADKALYEAKNTGRNRVVTDK